MAVLYTSWSKSRFHLPRLGGYVDPHSRLIHWYVTLTTDAGCLLNEVQTPWDTRLHSKSRLFWVVYQLAHMSTTLQSVPTCSPECALGKSGIPTPLSCPHLLS